MGRRTTALAALVAGCSEPGATSQPVQNRPTTTPAAARRASATKPKPAPIPAGSRILGKDDFTLRGKPACTIRFRYAGHTAETLF
ncbi:hypothetical protein ASG29_11825 [Sphingomonas sp. Leaf412]|uniref:hypothetical protein n=1 Tax=Sphingomonas sp. Leaf412 TaxID=1736370 RepID=UPI0007021615|nr:hypothetical protein [Sphingomonas sp. Leaf412]KQT32460.1 hypothetical protein ASG29_11825 [Sphingomonas sp. Leaf412]